MNQQIKDRFIEFKVEVNDIMTGAIITKTDLVNMNFVSQYIGALYQLHDHVKIHEASCNYKTKCLIEDLVFNPKIRPNKKQPFYRDVLRWLGVK